MKRRRQVISLLLLALGCAGVRPAIAQPAKSNSAEQESLRPLRIDTNLVTLSVGVNDGKGNPVSGLKQENFVIHEDGKLQTIEFFGQEDEPISFGVLLDSSQSMEISDKMDKAVAVALTFLRAGNPRNEAFCLAFNQTTALVSDFSSDFQQIEARLARLKADGGTAMYDAIVEGLERLTKAKHRRRALIVITDGLDQHSRHTLDSLIRRVQQSDAQIYAIGFFAPYEANLYQNEGRRILLGDDREADNPRFVFKALATETGAETYFPKTDKEFTEVISRIAGSLRRQYVLAYYPTNAGRDDEYRKITVRLKGADGRIRTRQGYRLGETLGSTPPSLPAPTDGPVTKPAPELALDVSLVRKEVSNAEELAPPLLQEKFDGAGNPPIKWPQTGKAFVEKGKLHAKGNTVIPIGKFVYQDFEASVTATFVTLPQRSTDPSRAAASEFLLLPTLGISFRINPEGYYTLMLAPKTSATEARYRIIKIADGRETEITGWRRYTALSLRNEIKLRCVGRRIEIFVGGMRLETLQDDAHKRGGISLLFSGETATFDDLTIKTLP